MSKNEEIQTVRVEIAAPDQGPRQDPRELIKELVEREVAEILAKRDSFLFEPFFRARKVANEIRRLRTVPELAIWGEHYEKYGCWHCGKRTKAHGGCGMCSSCYSLTHRHLSALRRNHKGRYEEGQYDCTVRDEEEIARQALLGTPATSERAYRTQNEAAIEAGINPKTLALWTSSGKFERPAKKMSSRKWMWTDEDVERLKAFKPEDGRRRRG